MLPAAHRLRRSGDFAATVRRGRRAARGSVVVHLLRPVSAPALVPVFSVDADAPRAGVTIDTPEVQPNGSPDLPDSGDRAAVEPARAGFVVSKAVGGAVVRNRVKRRLRHLMAERIERLPAGATVVVRAQPSAALRPYREMALDLENALDAALRSGRRQ